jgi:Domain of unknown function (DUF4124)/Bacterial Ig domain
MKKRAVLIAGVLCALAAVAHGSSRELWTWTDANGVTHYSDTPVPGAKKVQLSGYGAPPAGGSSSPATPPSSRGAPEEDEAISYRSVAIAQPAEGATFFGADATVSVSIDVDPAPAPAHRLVLYFDGKQVQGATNTRQYTIGNLARGTHTLAAVIQDENGAELMRSPVRTFYVQQPRADNPAVVGTSLKPKPPPTPAPRTNSPK